ncbi:MAG: multiheme c-type cytochrome, partial [Opitutus sp.]
MPVVLLLAALAGCGRNQSPPAPQIASAAAPQPRFTPSADCRSCHEEIHKAWSTSHHALAHRPIDVSKDAEAFSPARDFTLHGLNYNVGLEDGQAVLREGRPGQPPQKFVPAFVLAYTPLRQYVVPTGRGHYQLTELAWDPAKNEWFNVYGDERRQPGEWGHWLGRGMTWNSMCAHCHMTGFEKKYDLIKDTYASTWTEHGVGCTQCHGGLPANHTDPKRPPNPLTAFIAPAERQRSQETCAPCHARNELLTGTVVPGVLYHDHYRLTLPTEASTFYPDGQMRDEVFNTTSILTSRMGGKSGVTCMDCHDPHSGKTRLPVADNSLCMQCHAAPGRQNAIVIDPLAHSHHAADSKGNQCVSCHMPMTTYMQRDPRHD